MCHSEAEEADGEWTGETQEELEEYARELEAEIRGVRERIHELQGSG